MADLISGGRSGDHVLSRQLVCLSISFEVVDPSFGLALSDKNTKAKGGTDVCEQGLLQNVFGVNSR